MNGINIGGAVDPITTVISGDEPLNSLGEMVARSAGFHIEKELTVTGTGAQVANVLQLVGSVVILNQWALITEVTTLTNLTGMYADLYDGTNTVALTADGAVLSGAPVGTFFTKDKVAADAYSVSIADETRLLETLVDRKSGRPFTVTQKNATDTFIRLHFTTTDAPVSFKVKIHFEYFSINGSTLTFL